MRFLVRAYVPCFGAEGNRCLRALCPGRRATVSELVLQHMPIRTDRSCSGDGQGPQVKFLPADAFESVVGAFISTATRDHHASEGYTATFRPVTLPTSAMTTRRACKKSSSALQGQYHDADDHGSGARARFCGGRLPMVVSLRTPGTTVGACKKQRLALLEVQGTLA